MDPLKSVPFNHSVLPQHLGSVASFSLLLIPELNIVLPSKALLPLIAVHTQLVAQYTHMKLGHISYMTIYSVLDKLVNYLAVFEKILGSFQISFTKPCHISATLGWLHRIAVRASRSCLQLCTLLAHTQPRVTRVPARVHTPQHPT